MSVYLPALPAAGRVRPGRLAAAAAAALLLLVVVPLLVVVGTAPSPDLSGQGLPAKARPFLSIYADAAGAYRVSPNLLMAVHEDETNYSTSTLSGVADGVNLAGCCAGPMQFSITGAASNTAGGSGGTWASFADAYKKAHATRAADYPGHFSHHPNVYDSYDAIYAAASYLRSLGAGPQLDTRTLNALASYKGTPPASIRYAATTTSAPKSCSSWLPPTQAPESSATSTARRFSGSPPTPTRSRHSSCPIAGPAAMRRTSARRRSPTTAGAKAQKRQVARSQTPAWTARARCAGCSPWPDSPTPARSAPAPSPTPMTRAPGST
jgi:hypothetical protein